MPAPAVRELFAYLCVRGAANAIDFYARVFGAREVVRINGPDGRILHAEILLGPATMMLADEHPEHDFLSPLAFGGSGTVIHLHVDDVDAMARRATDAGATILSEPRDESHGERQCRLLDPFGHRWLLGHEIPSPVAHA